MLSPLFHVKQQNVYRASKNAFSQTRSPEKKNQGSTAYQNDRNPEKVI